jgi:hypothetical protein
MNGGVSDGGFYAVDLEVDGNPTSSTDAKEGDSLRFDGTGDRVQLMPWRAEDGILNRDHVAVSLWFKADADASNEKRILFDDTGSRGKQDRLAARINWAISPSKLQATCFRDNKQVSLEVEFSDTTSWHHVVVVKDDDRFAMFLDGVKVAEEMDLDTAASSSVNASVGESFKGRIDEVRVYRRTLTAPEIVDLNAASVLKAAEIWRGYYFNETDNTGLAADDQDGDNDGSLNVWERATGTSPTEAASVSLPEPEMTTDSGADFFSIQYRRLSGGSGTTGVNYSKDGLTWKVQTRTDLMTGSWAEGTSLVEQVGEPVDNGDGTETVTVRKKIDMDAEPISFLRVGVETLP